MLIKIPKKALEKIDRIRETAKGYTTKEITKPENIYEVLMQYFNNLNAVDIEKEHQLVVGLNGRLKLKYIELVSIGTLNASMVHPREIFRTAILTAAAKIIMAHNHPSGSIRPSEDDLEITHRITKAGKIIGIPLLDHLIISTKNHKWFSMADEGLIKE